jgi:hypothetical protein
MVDEEDIPSLDSWTERAADDLWGLGDEIERSVPVNLEFAPCMRIIVTIYTLGVSEDIMRGLMDHDENQRHLDGHSVAITNSVKPWNWFTTRNALVNTKLHLTARWRQLLISWNL